MNAERSDEEIRADLDAWFNGEPCRDLDDLHNLNLLADRLVDDIEPLLCRVAAVERERDQLRAENERWRERVNSAHAAHQECMGHEIAALARIAAVEAILREYERSPLIHADLLRRIVAALTASPTPTGPEPECNGSWTTCEKHAPRSRND